MFGYQRQAVRRRGIVALSLSMVAGAAIVGTTHTLTVEPPKSTQTLAQSSHHLVPVAASVPVSLKPAPPPVPLINPANVPETLKKVGCERGSSDSLGLTANAGLVYQAVCVFFHNVSSFGGARPGDWGDHGTGRAVDIMVGDDSAMGDQIAEFVLNHAALFNVNYVIWQQRTRYPGSGWVGMEDRGSSTANHYDHVHVSVY